MKIVNALIYRNRTFVRGSLEFGSVITSVGTDNPGGSSGIDAGGCFLIPGLVDIHTHGAMDADASDGDMAGLTAMSRYYASSGVTSWLPTTMTLKEPELLEAVSCVSRFRRPVDGARAVGIHLEGPFLSYEKRGAQNPDNLRAPDIDMFRRLNERSGGMVKLVTVAPEEPGAIGFIREASGDASVSLGHTAADYDTCMAAFDAGADHITHLYNGMPDLLHRSPGLIGAGSDAGACAEIISDGFHVHPSAVRAARKLFGEKLILISDSLRCAGMPDGEYELGGQAVSMKDGRAYLRGTDTIAGSSVHLMEALRRAVSFGIPLEDAVFAATEAPADSIRMGDRIGRIAPGRDADFVLLDRALNVRDVYIGGVPVRSGGTVPVSNSTAAR